ncbi:formiminoglutamase [Corynebacterium mustelae]|uniref:Formimidoylglutamase n=1 Tax=Corynebacterium mustelae TaxID=571915 RepID=A0A0G3GZK4_9CORY|nr:formimidoylglutamase [Corynebacterium mustelae]AKK05960.1 formiminoglutamase [Corynebacterium mustelae]
MTLNLTKACENWSGRVDGAGPDHARWHSAIASDLNRPGITLVGFASDEGVRRNQGRPGAAQATAALRTALSSLAIHETLPLTDAGTITVDGTDLESAHDHLSDIVHNLINKDQLVVVLGGGHETAFGSGRGAIRALPTPPKIINLDAHFDLREAPEATSGTPFRQLANEAGEKFAYHVLGISTPNNTKVLFDTARTLGVGFHTDTELLHMTPSDAAELATSLTENHEHIHLSIDLDVLPAAVAPGVSAPAGLGVELPIIHTVCVALAKTGKLRLVDVVELNPTYDVDGRTARVAARLINDIVTAHHRATIYAP